MSARGRWRWLLIAGLLPCLLAIWCVGIEPRWIAAREIKVQVADWQGPPGLRVAVASDWHFTRRALWRVTTPERARALVGQINAAEPDVVLIPGDLIADRDYAPERAATAEDDIASVLGGLRARLGVYVVLGNHDWWQDGPAMRAALTRAGLRVLENDAVRLPGTPLWIVGIGDHYTGHSDPQRALATVPAGAQTLVLMHDPASFANLPPVAGLTVAGHTHGGQVSLPGIGALIVPGAAPREWAYGWIAHRGNRMYVTSGIGVSILPLRLNVRPEWVMFTLDGASSAP